jgi:hypothetical protein
LAGIWSSDGPAPVYPSFGPSLRNHVEYVGPFHDGALERYRTRAAFTAGLRRSAPDLLVVGLGDPPLGETPEGAWARSAGYALVTRSRWLELYRRAQSPPRYRM